MDKILRVDVGAEGGPSVTVMEVGRYAALGGRAMTSTVVSEEVPPLCDPLGPENKLVIAPGIMSGSAATTSGRLSVGCKSPLTGGIKEANSGGEASQYLARLGYAAVILEGERQGDALYKIVIDKDGASVTECNEYRMKGNYVLADAIKSEHGDKVAMISIGPAGEQCLANSSVAVTDMEFRPTRHAGRGGVGAVMGAKGIKVIVVDPTGTSVRKPMNPEGFKAANKKLAEAMKASQYTGHGMPAFGTAMATDMTNEFGIYPTRNFSAGRYEKAAEISGGALAALEEERGGKGAATHGCHRGCMIKCSGTFADKSGRFLTKQPEYETLWAFGGNCDIADLDTIARMDRMCDDLGMDTMETGSTMAVLMEAKVLSFGDGEGIAALLGEVAQGTEKGRLVGAGTATVAKHHGVERAPVVKGQSMAAYEPRALKGLGVTYATSPMGADHTAGQTLAHHFLGVEPTSDPLDGNNQLLVSVMTQIGTAALDATGFCLFVGFAALDQPKTTKHMLDAMTAFTGMGFNEGTFAALGLRILRMEVDFNRRAGFTKEDDRLPEWMTREPVAPHDTVFDVPEETLDNVHNQVALLGQMLGRATMGVSPPIALMGEGCHTMVPDSLATLGVTKALIVTDRGVVEAGLAKMLTDALDAKFIEYAVYDGTKANPTVQNVQEGLEVYRKEGCDCLISLGGGSPHDCAKAVGVLAHNPGEILDYAGFNAVWNPIPILVAVNTTSGTGSDASFGLNILDPVRHIKANIADPKVAPIVSVNDPLMTKSMPPRVTAGTGMDALTHAIEAHVSTISSTYARSLAIDAIELIAQYLPRAVEDGEDLEAREKMCAAQYFAGLAMNGGGLGNTHSLAVALGAVYDLPHGDANAVMLPPVMRRNKPAIPERLAEIAQAMGVDTAGLSVDAAAEKAIEAVEALMDRIGMARSVSELARRCNASINPADIPELVSHAGADLCGAVNPIPYSSDDFKEIYEQMWG